MKKYWCQQKSGGVLRDSYIFLTVLSLIIVWYVWWILERGDFWFPLIREQSRKRPSWIGLKGHIYDFYLKFNKFEWKICSVGRSIIESCSHRRCSIRKGLLENLTKITGEHMYRSLFFNKVAGLRLRCFLVSFVKFSRTPFLRNNYRWLLFNRLKRRVARINSKNALFWNFFKFAENQHCGIHFPKNCSTEHSETTTS